MPTILNVILQDDAMTAMFGPPDSDSDSEDEEGHPYDSDEDLHGGGPFPFCCPHHAFALGGGLDMGDSSDDDDDDDDPLAGFQF